MRVFLLALQMMGYAMLGVAAILGLIFVLMKLVGRIAARKTSIKSESPPSSMPDDEDLPLS